ncbi:BrnT family toxin [Novosphingobium resinovorum]|uniref:BrnT family toxin n=1 Tax=Novosphingobium resinovorum TaxID=158500 RepID=UPI002ECFFB3E|nr:BrnT family toxin [Novosphingobium resinovorum]
MIIVWDEPKRRANLVKHGIDFADVTEDFFVSAMIRDARDGRYAAIGRMNGVIVVIFVMLGTEGVSIVSARPASARERRMIQ